MDDAAQHVVDLSIEAMTPDDYRVTITRSSGDRLIMYGREVDDLDEPFYDAEDILNFLLGERCQ